MIKNTTKKTILARKKITCKSAAEKAIGLMLSRPLKDEGMLFVFDKENRRELHMFFVFFPIDVLFLDKDKKVAEIKENFKPFTIYSSKKKAQYIIELPKGTVERTGTSVGDNIDI